MANTKPPVGRPFKKGNNANPRGAAAHNPVVKMIRRMTQEGLGELGSMILNGDIDGLREIKTNPTGHTAFKALLASAAVTAFDKGDMTAVNALLDRVVGKVKDSVHVTTETQKLTDDELRARIANLQKVLGHNEHD